MNNRDALKTIASVAQAIGFVAFVVVLYLARDVFIPLSLGILVAFLLSPVVNRLQRWGIPNVYAVVLTAIVVFLALSLAIFAIGNRLASLSTELPKYRGELQGKVAKVQEFTKSITSKYSQITEGLSNGTASGETSEEPESGIASTADATGANPLDPGKSPGGANENAAHPFEAIESNKTPESPFTQFLNRFGAAQKDEVPDGTSPQRPLYTTDVSRSNESLRTWAGGIVAILGPIGTAGLVTVFALFALIYRDDLRDRFTSVVSKGNYVVTAEALDEASTRISRYLRAQLTLNVSFGLVFAIGLFIIGITLTPEGSFPYISLLGVLAGLVRFIPYAGPIMGAAVPLLLSIAIFPGYRIFFAVAVLITVMELVSNNIVEPWLYGSSTGVSSVAIILSAVFWGWLWGPIGLLLATPLTVCTVVLGRYVPRFHFLVTLLSENIQVSPAIRGYQRLLSGDRHKIAEFFQSELEQVPLSELFDRNIIPIVKKIRSDRDTHKLGDNLMFDRLRQGVNSLDIPTSKELAALFETLEAQVAARNAGFDSAASIADAEATTEVLATAPKFMSGVAIAAGHRGEEIVLQTLIDQFQSVANVSMLDSDDLPDRESRHIVENAPDFVLIGVIPPRGFSQARYWCRSLRKSGYQGVIIVACFGRFKHYDKLFVGFRRLGADWMTTTFEQTTHKISSLFRVRSKNSRIVRKTSESVP